MRQDRDDAYSLVYGEIPEELALEEEGEEDDSESEDEERVETGRSEDGSALESAMDVDFTKVAEEVVRILDEKRDERMASPRPLTPPLPLSPISNPSTPPRKRPRTAHWQPPPHVPDFLPPFPSHTPRHTPSPPPLALPPAGSSILAPISPIKLERPVTPPPELPFGVADYRTSVPYSASLLASQPVWHLPARPSTPPHIPRNQDLPITQSALYHAYHHALTHPPPKELGPTNTGRYNVALELIEQTEAVPRWDPPCTLYGNSIPDAPRVSAMGPSFPVPIVAPDGKDKGKEADAETKLPNKPPRSIVGTERIASLISQQTSRLPALALQVLPVSRLHRR